MLGKSQSNYTKHEAVYTKHEAVYTKHETVSQQAVQLQNDVDEKGLPQDKASVDELTKRYEKLTGAKQIAKVTTEDAIVHDSTVAPSKIQQAVTESFENIAVRTKMQNALNRHFNKPGKSWDKNPLDEV